MSEGHVGEAVWRVYAAGGLDAAAEAAVETHVTGCPACRDGARALSVDPAPTWAAVHAEITRPRLPSSLRWLARLGVRDHDLVVLAAADGLRLPWAVAVGGAIAAVIAASATGRFQEPVFWLLAPLVPVLAVVAAYDATDPLRELVAPTSGSKLRLTLLRTVATLAVALPATLVLSGAIPVLAHLAWAWLLPSLVLTCVALLLLTRWEARVVGAVVGAGWAVAVGALDGAGGLAALGGAPAQAGAALLASVLAGALVAGTAAPVHSPGGPS